MYDGTHSITFGSGTFSERGKLTGKNTWKDWWLIPDDRPDAAEPGVITKMIEVPGRHGTLDLTDWMTGGPVYQDRSGSWKFTVDNDRPSWVQVKEDLMEYLHGKRMKCVLEDDPNYYYEGRFRVKWNSGQNYSKVTIDYVLSPYKKHWNPQGDWLWDPFNFEMDRTDMNVEEKL